MYPNTFNLIHSQTADISIQSDQFDIREVGILDS